jgi:hypothetical protein
MKPKRLPLAASPDISISPAARPSRKGLCKILGAKAQGLAKGAGDGFSQTRLAVRPKKRIVRLIDTLFESGALERDPLFLVPKC